MNKPNRREFLRPMAVSAAALAVGACSGATSARAETVQNQRFDVRTFGAKGDKTTNDSAAIQAAIDACHRSGGGEVVVPAGDYFSGGILLRSHVTFRLENGATIWASGNWNDYSQATAQCTHGYLLNAHGQENLVVCGDGAIVGTGQQDMGRRAGEPKVPRPAHRFGIVHCTDCKSVRLRDFGIRYSEAHTVVLERCEEVCVDRVSIFDNFFRVNTDGIDVTSSKNVLISNCYIVAGDDGICLKSDGGRPVENVVVTNCILESVAGAFKLGTGSRGDFRNITVSNLVIRNSGVGLGLFIKDGGTVEGLSFSNISIETTRPGVPITPGLRNNIFPVYIDLTKRRENSQLSQIRDVSFADIQIASDNSIVIQGLPQRAIEDLTLRGITFRVTGGFDFSHRTEREGGQSSFASPNRTRFVRQPTYGALAYVHGLAVDGFRVTIPADVAREFPRSALALFHCQDGAIENIWRRSENVPGAPPAVVTSDSKGIALEMKD